MAADTSFLFRASIFTGDEDDDEFRVLESMARDAGKGVHTILHLRSCAVLEHLWVAKKEGRILGFLLISPVDTLDIWELNQKLGEEGIVIPEEPSLHLLDLVVDRWYRNTGIGTELVRGILEHEMYDVNRRYPVAIATSRVPLSGDRKGTSYNVLRRNGFVEVGNGNGKIQNFYRGTKDWTCPTCGDGYCTCFGIMMRFDRRPE
jgi:ribosomal protein S18 acetylase RimI-like enzyme